jgi:hypothetical protein
MKVLIIISFTLIFFGCNKNPVEIIPIYFHSGDGVSEYCCGDSCGRIFVVKNFSDSNAQRDSVVQVLQRFHDESKATCFNTTYFVVNYHPGTYDEKSVYYNYIDATKNFYQFELFDIQWVNGKGHLNYNYHKGYREGYDIE